MKKKNLLVLDMGLEWCDRIIYVGPMKFTSIFDQGNLSNLNKNIYIYFMTTYHTLHTLSDSKP